MIFFIININLKIKNYLGLGNSFHIPPFFAALQHQQFLKSIHLASASSKKLDGAISPRISNPSSSRVNSPERILLDGEDEFDSFNLNGIYQPEDLSIGG